MTLIRKALPGNQNPPTNSEVLHTPLAGFIQDSQEQELTCEACQLKTRDFRAFVRELARMGPVERFW